MKRNEGNNAHNPFSEKENSSGKAACYFSFAFDWSKGGAIFLDSIAEHSEQRTVI